MTMVNAEEAAQTNAPTETGLLEEIRFKLRRAIAYAQFAYAQRVIGFSVGDTPEFEPECLPFFMDRLAAAGSYLEFGTGGSTLLAAKRGLPFIAVESDPFFLRAVKRKVRDIGALDEARQHYLHADIGLTEAWGAPLMQYPRPDRITRWRGYPLAPWQALAAMPGPHLILVDGRFRVACALAAAKFLIGRDGEVLFDDYADRPYYHVVERYLEPVERVGRMARFKVRANINAAALDAEFERHCADWR